MARNGLIYGRPTTCRSCLTLTESWNGTKARAYGHIWIASRTKGSVRDFSMNIDLALIRFIQYLKGAAFHFRFGGYSLLLECDCVAGDPNQPGVEMSRDAARKVRALRGLRSTGIFQQVLKLCLIANWVETRIDSQQNQPNVMLLPAFIQ